MDSLYHNAAGNKITIAETVAGWLVQGAKGPDAAQQEMLTMPKTSDALAIKEWEAFLNQDDAKHAMTARYLIRRQLSTIISNPATCLL